MWFLCNVNHVASEAPKNFLGAWETFTGIRISFVSSLPFGALVVFVVDVALVFAIVIKILQPFSKIQVDEATTRKQGGS